MTVNYNKLYHLTINPSGHIRANLTYGELITLIEMYNQFPWVESYTITISSFKGSLGKQSKRHYLRLDDRKL